MKRIEWIQESGASVQEIADIMASLKWCPRMTNDTACDGECSMCAEKYLLEEIDENTPAELKTQTGANENITNDIVTYKEEDVNMDKSIKDQFLESSKNILGLVAEIHKKYGVIDFCNSGTRVHMKESEFLKVFSNDSITASVRDEKQFPYEYSVMVDGIKYFCISKLPPLEFGRSD